MRLFYLALVAALLGQLVLAGPVVAQEKSCCAVGTRHGMGSGTVVVAKEGQHYILTNKHVVHEGAKVWVLYQRKRYDAVVVARHESADLALVSCKLPKETEAAPLAQDEAPEGTEVRHWGRASEYQEGQITGQTRFQSKDGLVNNGNYFSVAGDSGAGVFDKKGQLVGVNYGRAGDPDGPYENTYALMVRLAHIREFIKGYK